MPLHCVIVFAFRCVSWRSLSDQVLAQLEVVRARHVRQRQGALGRYSERLGADHNDCKVGECDGGVVGVVVRLQKQRDIQDSQVRQREVVRVVVGCNDLGGVSYVF
jgi:hypothetical protein